MAIDLNQTIPVTIRDLLRMKDFLTNGGRHAEGVTLCDLIDARFDAWEVASKSADKPAPPAPQRKKS